MKLKKKSIIQKDLKIEIKIMRMIIEKKLILYLIEG
jgi:hypothetical protein